MFSSTSLIFGVLFGSIGMAYMVYGKKQKKGVALVCGVALCAVPYFFSSIIILILIGVVLMAAPFFIKY